VAVPLFFLTWIFYATTAQMAWMVWRDAPLPTAPVVALEPFRIANQFGLFAVMTRGRYEIEFQGSTDGETWTPYPFRYKPQDLNAAPRIFAPYQPRFDWNLWFASLDSWQQNDFVVAAEERLLTNSQDVIGILRWWVSFRSGRHPGEIAIASHMPTCQDLGIGAKLSTRVSGFTSRTSRTVLLSSAEINFLEPPTNVKSRS
jgi:hypothetical protein